MLPGEVLFIPWERSLTSSPVYHPPWVQQEEKLKENQACVFMGRYGEYPSFHKNNIWEITSAENDTVFWGGSKSTAFQARAEDKKLPCLAIFHRISNISHSVTLWGSPDLRLSRLVHGKALAMVLSIGTSSAPSPVTWPASTQSFHLYTLQEGHCLSQPLCVWSLGF